MYACFTPCSFPKLTPPVPSLMVTLLPSAFVIVVVSFAITISLGQVFAQQFNYSISSNQVRHFLCMFICTTQTIHFVHTVSLVQ